MVLNTEESIKHYCADKVLKYFGTQATRWGSTWESIEVSEGQGKPSKEQFDTKLQEYMDEFTYEVLRKARDINSKKQISYSYLIFLFLQMMYAKHGKYIAETSEIYL